MTYLSLRRKNAAIISYLLRSEVDSSHVAVSCQKKWINYRKLQSSHPEVYEFVRTKFNLGDADIIGLSAYITNFLPKNLTMSMKADKVTFVTDYMCNLFLNQTTDGFDKYFAEFLEAQGEQESSVPT